MGAATEHAEERARREGIEMVVYHLASDRWGRDAVFFVRSATDEVPYGLDGKRADVVYRAKPPEKEEQ